MKNLVTAALLLGGLAGCVVAGLLAGLLSVLLTLAVYASEDAFLKLPIHWMWWPILGGLVIGLGGYIFPPALGVGYDSIRALLQEPVALKMILGILLVKSTIWAVSLGSGTSGGVLAPLLMMGGALGGLEATVLPFEGVGFWPLVSMGAILGGTMRSPFTGIVFAFELTHDPTIMLPLLVAAALAHATTVLLLPRSILTEKVSRRGYHMSREYAVDPLETLLVREVLRPDPASGPARSRPAQPDPAAARARRAVAHADDTLRTVVARMAATGLTTLPVVERGDGSRRIGVVTLTDLLAGRVRLLEAEERRERVIMWPAKLRGLRPAADR